MCDYIGLALGVDLAIDSVVAMYIALDSVVALILAPDHGVARCVGIDRVRGVAMLFALRWY